MSSRVGPYRLEEQIGSGGMGVVWKATHIPSDLPVAVKVMRAETSSFRAQQAFLNEIHQASKLLHPNIVRIFDFSTTTDPHASTSETDSSEIPYIAMELSSRGSLDQLDEVLHWKDLLGICRSLLEAIAHAHARGVLHRDIKPGNILLGSRSDARPSIKLSDFGLAMTHAETVAPNTSFRVVGTPEYMAPEQIEGLWRNQGPWTDIYALGCVAYELATGWPPFTGESPRDIALGHLSSPVPPLRAMTEVPEGFESWLLRMLAKEPEARFQCAADAAYALEQIDMSEAGPKPLVGRKRSNPASPTWTFMDLDLPRNDAQRKTIAPAIHPEDAPEPIEDWTSIEPQPEPFHLANSSLQLVRLKHTQIVGRTTERSELWSTLYDVVKTGYPRAVVLRGAAGMGKRRLAQWVSETAHKAGMAQTLTANHEELAGAGHGLPRMFAQHLHTRELNGPSVITRTQEVLTRWGMHDPYDGETLGRAILAASGAVSSTDIVPGGPVTERLALYERVLEQMATHRPIILHISNPHWGGEALLFAQRLLRNRASSLPIMIVLTCDKDTFTHRQHELRQLEQLMGSANCSTIDIGPLPESDQQQLIESILHVEPRLARSIRERTGGSPLFAVQVVEDLVQRGVLEASPDGFRSRDEGEARLPASIHSVWQTRLQACLSDLPETALQSLQVAAALGTHIEPTDWEEGCAAFGIEIPNHILTRLARAELIDTHESGWSFTHAMLRESITKDATDTWSGINLACADMLERRPAGPGMSQRIGQHLVAAEDQTRALPHLLAAAEEAREAHVAADTLNLLDLFERCLTTLEKPESDPNWGDLWLNRTSVNYNLQNFEAAQAWSIRACDAALQHSWGKLLPSAFRWRGITAMNHNEYAVADAMFARAMSFVSDQTDQEQEQARIYRHWGHLLRRMGKGEASWNMLETAATMFDKLGEGLEAAYVRFHQAEVQSILFQADDRAESHLNDAIQRFMEHNHIIGQGDCWNGLAEIHRSRGDLAAAETDYLKAEAMFHRAGIDRAVIPQLNRALLHLQQDHIVEADVLLQQVRSSVETAKWPALLPYVHAGLLVCAASKTDWDTWDIHEQALRESILRTPVVERDLAQPLQRAGDMAHVESQIDRAHQVWKIALDQWTSLGDTERAGRLERRLHKESN